MDGRNPQTSSCKSTIQTSTRIQILQETSTSLLTERNGRMFKFLCVSENAREQYYSTAKEEEEEQEKDEKRKRR